MFLALSMLVDLLFTMLNFACVIYYQGIECIVYCELNLLFLLSENWIDGCLESNGHAFVLFSVFC